MELDECVDTSSMSALKTELIESDQLDTTIEGAEPRCEGCLGVENLLSMTDTPGEKKTGEDYFELFRRCFNIEVGSRNIALGTTCYICEECVYSLKLSYLFRIKVISSQKKLNKAMAGNDGNESESTEDETGDFMIVEPLLFMKSNKPDPKTKTKAKRGKKDIKKEIKVEVKYENEHPRSDGEEKKMTIYQRELNRLKLLYYKIDQNTTKCNKCSARFKTHHRLLIHIKKHYTEHICFKCHLKFKTSQAVNEHLKNVCMREFRYGCPNCDEGFMSDLSRKKHMKVVHNLDVEVFSCNQCDRQFLNYHQMVTHVEGVHQKVRDRECPVCGKFYYNKRIHKHLKSHNLDRSCTCDVCGKSFGTVDTLKRHKKVHLPKEHICPCCGMEFTYKNSYKLHMNRYHPEFSAGDEKQMAEMDDNVVHYETIIEEDNDENESGDDDIMMTHQ